MVVIRFVVCVLIVLEGCRFEWSHRSGLVVYISLRPFSCRGSILQVHFEKKRDRLGATSFSVVSRLLQKCLLVTVFSRGLYLDFFLQILFYLRKLVFYVVKTWTIGVILIGLELRIPRMGLLSFEDIAMMFVQSSFLSEFFFFFFWPQNGKIRDSKVEGKGDDTNESGYCEITSTVAL